MKALVVRTDADSVQIIDFQKGNLLHTLYKEIGCNVVEVVSNVDVGGIKVDIWTDEEGLFKKPLINSARNLSYPDQRLFGNIVLTPAELDEYGDVARGFTKTEIMKISENIAMLIDFENGLIRPFVYYKWVE